MGANSRSPDEAPLADFCLQINCHVYSMLMFEEPVPCPKIVAASTIFEVGERKKSVEMRFKWVDFKRLCWLVIPVQLFSNNPDSNSMSSRTGAVFVFPDVFLSVSA